MLDLKNMLLKKEKRKSYLPGLENNNKDIADVDLSASKNVNKLNLARRMTTIIDRSSSINLDSSGNSSRL